jgi:hypothetical protein
MAKDFFIGKTQYYTEEDGDYHPVRPVISKSKTKVKVNRNEGEDEHNQLLPYD